MSCLLASIFHQRCVAGAWGGRGVRQGQLMSRWGKGQQTHSRGQQPGNYLGQKPWSQLPIPWVQPMGPAGQRAWNTPMVEC